MEPQKSLLLIYHLKVVAFMFKSLKKDTNTLEVCQEYRDLHFFHIPQVKTLKTNHTPRYLQKVIHI